MTAINLAEASVKLPLLIQQALAGEEVVIQDEDKPLVRLLPVESTQARPRFGSAKGQIILGEDFDSPLEDFQDYQP